MTIYGYTNEAGEPMMDAAAYRFEQQLDAEYAEEAARMAYDEDFYANYPYDEPDWCHKCGEECPEGEDEHECPEDIYFEAAEGMRDDYDMSYHME